MLFKVTLLAKCHVTFVTFILCASGVRNASDLFYNEKLTKTLWEKEKNFEAEKCQMFFHPQSAVNIDDEFLSDALRVDGIDDRVNRRDVLMEHLKMTLHF